jgi:ABC-type multidrug transport system fused ATPase/permease subunit
VLILDDSTSALDFATDASLRKAIRELTPRPTLFIVSQRAASVMHADKIAVLDRGEIVGMGKHEELLETCEVYKEIYNSQFRANKEAAI